MMVYLTYAEGFTSASDPIVTIGPNSVISSMPASACADASQPDTGADSSPAEIIDNTEIGLRSDWLDGRLRFNATYFDSNWDGMRVALLPTDCAGQHATVPVQHG